MMQTVVVRGVEIGAGKPKICVPVVERTREEILQAARSLGQVPFDIVEWRMDWYEQVEDQTKVAEVLDGLREILGDKPILATFRSQAEGGECTVPVEYYETLLTDVAGHDRADLVDVELFTGDEVVKRIMDRVHEKGCRVIASSHDFAQTPEEEELIRRLCRMQEMGADIAKVAVMPKCRQDVLTLLSATERMNREYARIPVVTMSMGSMGMISRLAGECFGSAMTFGAAGKVSAPGQMDAVRLEQVLEAIHQSM